MHSVNILGNCKLYTKVGWTSVLSELVISIKRRLEKCQSRHASVVFTDIYQKNNRLEVNFSSDNLTAEEYSDIQDLIILASNRSEKVCERCGLQSRLGFYFTNIVCECTK